MGKSGLWELLRVHQWWGDLWWPPKALRNPLWPCQGQTPCASPAPWPLLLQANFGISPIRSDRAEQSVMRCQGFPSVCSRPTPPPCSQDCSYTEYNMTKIDFSKLQLLFGFVSLKLHSGPLYWSFEYSQSFQSHIYGRLVISRYIQTFTVVWFISRYFQTNIFMYYVWVYRWCLRGQVYSQPFAGSCGHSHILSTYYGTVSPVSRLFTLFMGNPPISIARGPMRGTCFHLPPKFLNGVVVGIVSVETGSHLSKVYKFSFKTWETQSSHCGVGG